MKIYPDTKIYVICPSKMRSGGLELCHQLCSQLISHGFDSKIVYINVPAPFKNDPVHDLYRKYHLPYVFHFEDSAQNVLIVPEIFTRYFYAVDKIQCVLWWMSVDNYLKNILNLLTDYLEDSLFAPLSKFFYFSEADKNIEHWVQSEYARQFVKLNGVTDDKIFMVEDYLNQAFLSRADRIDLSKKEDLVIYNPRKGFATTKKFIDFAPEIDWRAIENMTPAQVQMLLARAKIYIDFGDHPGKDRIPREAAISGCVVITNRCGAANNDIDINIPDEFKFDERHSRAEDVIKKIREVFEKFEAAHEKQAAYRRRILEDKNRFAHEVADVFGIKKFPSPSVAFTQGVSEKSFLLAQGLFQNGSLMPKFIVDDVLAKTQISNELLRREQNRNYLRVGENLVEIITPDDAKFLYWEGRIKKFALLAPTASELSELKNFYEAASEDILIF